MAKSESIAERVYHPQATTYDKPVIVVECWKCEGRNIATTTDYSKLYRTCRDCGATWTDITPHKNYDKDVNGRYKHKTNRYDRYDEDPTERSDNS